MDIFSVVLSVVLEVIKEETRRRISFTLTLVVKGTCLFMLIYFSFCNQRNQLTVNIHFYDYRSSLISYGSSIFGREIKAIKLATIT